MMLCHTIERPEAWYLTSMRAELFWFGSGARVSTRRLKSVPAELGGTTVFGAGTRLRHRAL